jgi:hypothetical protein
VVSSVAGNVARFASPDSPEREDSQPFDTLVTVSANVPDAALYEELRGGPWEVRLAGDAQGPRLLEAATFEGNQAIRSLEAGWLRPVVRFGQTGSAM